MSPPYQPSLRDASVRIRKGQLLKRGTSASTVAVLLAADAISLLYAVALQDARAGQSLLVSTLQGAQLELYSDGAGVLTEGAALQRSTTVDGAVAALAAGEAIARAEQGAPAAEGARVLATYGGPGSGGAPATATLQTAYAAGDGSITLSASDAKPLTIAVDLATDSWEAIRFRYEGGSDAALGLIRAYGTDVVAKGAIRVQAEGDGMSVTLLAAPGTVTFPDGGDVVLIPGAPSGAGASGDIIASLAQAGADFRVTDGAVNDLFTVDRSGNVSADGTISQPGGISVAVNGGNPTVGRQADPTTYLIFGGQIAVTSSGGAFRSLANKGESLGTFTELWSYACAGLFHGEMGADIASATTIAPTCNAHKVTGTASVVTITAPNASFRGTIHLLPVAAFTWQESVASGGNIKAAGTAVAGRALTMTYDGALWWPSYI